MESEEKELTEKLELVEGLKKDTAEQQKLMDTVEGLLSQVEGTDKNTKKIEEEKKLLEE